MVCENEYVADFRAWLSAPLFGVGYSQNETINSFRNYSLQSLGIASINGSSNGILLLAAQGGIALLSVYLIPMIGIFTYSRNKKYRGITMFVIILLIELFTTAVSYAMLILYLVSLFYAVIFSNQGHEKLEHK